MSNEEILQEYNERLEENNTSLANVLETINNLPEATSDSGSSIDVYSTEETVIGTWLGKPLYRKILVIGSLPPKDKETDYPHNISNLDIFTRIVGSASYTLDGVFYQMPLPNIGALANTNSVQVNRKGDYITISNGRDRTMWSGYLILEYTKTTD